MVANGADTGAGFTLDQIEADPTAFFTDTHTSAFASGAVCGQLTAIPVGGVETGADGTSQLADHGAGLPGGAVAPVVGVVGGTALLAAGGALALRRRTVQQ